MNGGKRNQRRKDPARHGYGWSLLRKGLTSFREQGIRVTGQRTLTYLYGINGARRIARSSLFTEKELAQQRKKEFPRKIRFSIVVPLYNTPVRFLREMIASVQAQTYPDWELCMADGSDDRHPEAERVCRELMAGDARIRYRRLEGNRGISGNTNACLEMAEGDYIALFDHDDLLHPAALHEVMRAICEKDADFVYTDEKTFHNDPTDVDTFHFKPAFAPDTLVSNNYICHFSVFRRSLLEEAGLFEPACDGSQDHDMILRLTEKARKVVHIPEVLYYWRAHSGSVADGAGRKPYVLQAGIRAVERYLERTGRKGEVSLSRPGIPIYRVRYEIQGTPMISILISGRKLSRNLKKCLNSVFKKTSYRNYETVIVQSGGITETVASYCEKLRQEHDNVRVITWEGTFSRSAVLNFGARHCRGEYILLLDGETEVITPDWLQEMLMFAQRPDVGAVGAKLYSQKKTILQGGLVLRSGTVAGVLHRAANRDNLGYMGRLIYAQNASAVSGDCMLLRREVWDRMGGMDEQLTAAFEDVDLCLRIRKAGFLNVWTPFAELYGRESAGRGGDGMRKRRKRFGADAAMMRRRWKRELESGDPYYNPNFNPYRTDCSFARGFRPYEAR